MTETALPFVDYARPTHPFSGLVILGEAPGADEVLQGRPFVGRSGKLLAASLDAAGIDRDACLVANVFRYRPPRNNVGVFFESKKAAIAGGNHRGLKLGNCGRGFLRAAYAAELDALTVALSTARAVLALGTIPLWATTGAYRLGQAIGLSRPCRLAVPLVIPTYHPAFILRGNYELMPTWREHFARAIAAASPR